MKSSAGTYYAGLDHVRALAAFLVVVWHFAHWTEGKPVPFNQAPLLGPLDEGHVGVSVFMVLSGYLFAKLIGDKEIRYLPFLWNRAIRLLPLLLLTLAIYAVVNRVEPLSYMILLSGAVLLPVLPNGGWSITAESHFYMILPLALAAMKKDPNWALCFLAASISLRLVINIVGIDIQFVAYYTIFGRIDQFVFGISAFRLGNRVTGRVALLCLLVLWIFYGIFDALGGFYNLPDKALWIGIPTIEGSAIAGMIAWYDRNPLPHNWFLQKAGEYSYSIYLLHFFFVHEAAQFVDENVMAMPTLIHALPWAMLFYLGMMIVGHVSWKLVEEPALRYRRRYVVA